ncbi:AAA family ATPase [Acetivibrio clariflavus]|uniref:MoxR-like ATPase n=1 Tax=Acetivibrio clariflavus (strain DSM 19732 / NBRC 101661 / EBR45) TaxID=720554 RepID=G8M205_ACECE|nr:MoxR family ATPase [Acetivibrio clariflavus]AEV68123.1 MoxR-like ATPase [Acetivibrio clariflavus DSM 19732]
MVEINSYKENDVAGCEFTKEKAKAIIEEISKIVVGQYQFIEHMVVALLSGGHVLIEGVPGLAKTLASKVMSRAIDADFKRVQFTPDLMPADIIGTKVFDPKKTEFFLKKGPLFTDIFLADEINRTPPKTQAALLEAMEERAISIDGETHKLSDMFMVLATQNPVEYEGTYPLPEAQLDRFLMKLLVDYMPHKFENMLLQKYNSGFNSKEIENQNINVVCTFEDIKRCREEIQGVQVNEGIINYITSIVRATRNSPTLALGASPRASIALLLTAKTYAAMDGRNYVIPEDVKELALPVLRHRIIIKPEAGIDGLSNDDAIKNILAKVEVPR